MNSHSCIPATSADLDYGDTIAALAALDDVDHDAHIVAWERATPQHDYHVRAQSSAYWAAFEAEIAVLSTPEGIEGFYAENRARQSAKISANASTPNGAQSLALQGFPSFPSPPKTSAAPSRSCVRQDVI